MNSKIGLPIKNRTQRTKSQSLSFKNYHQLKPKVPNLSKTSRALESHRCVCCQQKTKYPDYLAQLRKERIQRIQKKTIAQMLMQNHLPLSSPPNHDEMQEDDDQNFISRISNKISEYEVTPKKSLLKSFHDSIIKSHEGKQIWNSSRNQGKCSNFLGKVQVNKKNEEEIFEVEIEILDQGAKQSFYRSFSAIQYANKAVHILEEKLQLAYANS